MFDLIKFIQPAYLFDFRPYTSLQTIKTMMIFFGLITVSGIIVKIFQRSGKLEKFQQKLLEKKASLLITMGLLGILLTWTRYERVQILSARFWLIIWLIVLIIWLCSIIKYRLKVVPIAKKRSEENKLVKKYLPGKK